MEYRYSGTASRDYCLLLHTGNAANGKQGVHPFPAPAGYHKFDVMDTGTSNLVEGESLELKDLSQPSESHYHDSGGLQ